MLGVLDDPPAGLAELRGALMREHELDHAGMVDERLTTELYGRS